MMGEGFIDAWTVRDLVALIGTVAIVLGLSNLTFGGRKKNEHLKRTEG